MTLIKLKKADIRPILAVSFPEYKGRRFQLRISDKVCPGGNWEGGSRTVSRAVGIRNDAWAAIDLPQGWGTAPLNIPENVLIINHIVSCGQDLGIVVVMPPNSIFSPKLLPAKA